MAFHFDGPIRTEHAIVPDHDVCRLVTGEATVAKKLQVVKFAVGVDLAQVDDVAFKTVSLLLVEAKPVQE